MDGARAAPREGRREEVALPTRVLVARRALAATGWLLAAGVLVQIFLAGRGVFVGPGEWAKHRAFVHAFVWLSPLAVVLAYVGRAPRAEQVDGHAAVRRIEECRAADDVARRRINISSGKPAMLFPRERFAGIKCFRGRQSSCLHGDCR